MLQGWLDVTLVIAYLILANSQIATWLILLANQKMAEIHDA